ncbi:hypothetical protein LCGC14_1467430 [marine sediment metagenome]|uniref:Zinc finger CHC2-type domain-containing protein n=1 Tax=marine sediment metagenome TaxID=412755 RepID=A0A0F9JE00_9ZZZZ
MTTETEGWASLILEDMRRLTDPELAAELVYWEREKVEHGSPVDQRCVEMLRSEVSRRERLATMGSPQYRGDPVRLQERIDRVKECIDILAVADLLGIGYPDHQVGQQVRYSCPVHGDGTDRNPSGVLHLDTNRWHCFGCNSGGSMFDLLIAFGKAPHFLAALHWLEAHCGIAPPKVESRKHSGGYPL